MLFVALEFSTHPDEYVIEIEAALVVAEKSPLHREAGQEHREQGHGPEAALDTAVAKLPRLWAAFRRPASYEAVAERIQGSMGAAFRQLTPGPIQFVKSFEKTLLLVALECIAECFLVFALTEPYGLELRISQHSV